MTEKLTKQDQSIESPKNKKEWYEDKNFWHGFWGWFVFNGLVWLPVMHNDFAMILWLILIPINVGGLIYFAFKRRSIALGLLSAFAANFMLLLIRGMAEQVICFSPFFIDIDF